MDSKTKNIQKRINILLTKLKQDIRTSEHNKESFDAAQYYIDELNKIKERLFNLDHEWVDAFDEIDFDEDYNEPDYDFKEILYDIEEQFNQILENLEDEKEKETQTMPQIHIENNDTSINNELETDDDKINWNKVNAIVAILSILLALVLGYPTIKDFFSNGFKPKIDIHHSDLRFTKQESYQTNYNSSFDLDFEVWTPHMLQIKIYPVKYSFNKSLNEFINNPVIYDLPASSTNYSLSVNNYSLSIDDKHIKKSVQIPAVFSKFWISQNYLYYTRSIIIGNIALNIEIYDVEEGKIIEVKEIQIPAFLEMK